MAKRPKPKRSIPRPTRHHVSLAALGVAAITALITGTQLLHNGRASSDPVIVAVGDIACDPADSNYNGGNGTATRCHMKATSDLAISLNPTSVLVLGDNQYETGTLAAYQASYDPTWGRLKSITKPAPGNHEYFTVGAAGYFDYFGAAAGDRSKGYYSYNLGNWHVVSLNSNCAAIGGCQVGSAQNTWLRADLASHTQPCTLAYWHHPRFSSGSDHGNDATMQPLWEAAHEARVDVILTGHDHAYERFAPQNATGGADASGPVEFVVGSGGKNLFPFGTIRANSAFRYNANYGVLKMALHSTSYDWQFVAEGVGVVDSGSANCVTPPKAATAVPVANKPVSQTQTNKAVTTAATPAATAVPTPVSETPKASPTPSAKAANETDEPASDSDKNLIVQAAEAVGNFFVTAWNHWAKVLSDIF